MYTVGSHHYITVQTRTEFKNSNQNAQVTSKKNECCDDASQRQTNSTGAGLSLLGNTLLLKRSGRASERRAKGIQYFSGTYFRLSSHMNQ